MSHWGARKARRVRAARLQIGFMSVSYPVVLKKSEEGYAVGCPALPGCWSQGATEEEALENIRIAIREYLKVLRA